MRDPVDTRYWLATASSKATARHLCHVAIADAQDTAIRNLRINNSDIRALQREAAEAGDDEQVRLCRVALGEVS